MDLILLSLTSRVSSLAYWKHTKQHLFTVSEPFQLTPLNVGLMEGHS